MTIAVGAAALAMIVARLGAIELVDTGLYDYFFKKRPPESQYDSPVLIVVADQGSVDQVLEHAHNRWPWPRDYWAALIGYLNRCGARAIAFDLFFDEPSADKDLDRELAEALDASTVPVVISQRLHKNGKWADFAPPVKRPATFGTAEVIDAAKVRTYSGFVAGRPSLAVEVARAVGAEVPDWAKQTFRLHFYGPTKRPDGTGTFHYVPAYQSVLLATSQPASKIQDLSAETFRDKIVVIGATAVAAFDLKDSPVNEKFPGVEIQATAISNLLENRHVHVVPEPAVFLTAVLAAVVAAAGAVIPRQALPKLVIPVVALVGVAAAGYLMFVRFHNIYWLPLGAPLLAAMIATVAGLSWTYFVEDRERRLLLKFLAQYVSPDVAAELDRQGEVSLGGVRREMTVMFTDLKGFTDMSERMEPETIERIMNVYLTEMSAVVFADNGTLDKYIGDSIMTFWNAPLNQPEHAVLACRTALGMKRREEQLRESYRDFALTGSYTRIGVNTGPMMVGNFGSTQKVNYTVLGDSVNLASRLEGANKIYGTHIVVAEPTVQLVNGKFLFRKLDLLRVKGRKQPMAVYELLAEGQGEPRVRDLAGRYEQAFAAYQRRDWASAEATLVALLADFADDGPSTVLLQRVRGFRDNPPPPDWDGVHVATDK